MVIAAAAQHYFDVADLRALPDLSDETRYPDAALNSGQAYVESLIDRVCRTSFVYRQQVDTLSGSSIDARGQLRLTKPYPQQLISVTVDGLDLDDTGLAGLTLSPAGMIGPQLAGPGYTYPVSQDWGPVGGVFGVGTSNVIVTYTAGWSATCPADLSGAALKAARGWVLAQYGASGAPDRAMSLTNEFGNVQLATASVKRPTGYPDVDAVILGYASELAPVGIW